MLKVLDVDGAVRRVRGGWLATGEPWVYDEARLRRVAEARDRRAAAMLEYAATDRLPHASSYAGRLDDPARPPAAAATAVPAPVRRATCRRPRSPPRSAFLGRPGVEIAPKKLWPTGLDAVGVPLKGRIAAAEQAAARPGRRAASPTWAGVAGCAHSSARTRPTARSPTTSPAPSWRC